MWFPMSLHIFIQLRVALQTAFQGTPVLTCEGLQEGGPGGACWAGSGFLYRSSHRRPGVAWESTTELGGGLSPKHS